MYFKKTTSYILFLALFLYSNIASAWYDSNAQGLAPEWNYRVAINIPASATINSTIKFDVNFNTLLTALNVTGTFDINSPRIVRPNESLAASQEYTDRIFNNVLDAANNNRGQVKFILQDAGPSTYYLYFDITENGAKTANPQATINGNFEHSVGSTPTNWTVSSVNANGAQNNEVYDTSFGDTFSQATPVCSDQALNNINNSPNNAGSAATTTGRKWHLNGYRNNCEDGTGRENINLSRTISVPATNPGTLTFYFQLQAYDSWNGVNQSQYDYFHLDVNGTPVNHTTLGINNTGNPLRIEAGGVGRRNQYSAALVDAGWKLATLNLAPYAGSNIAIMFTTDFFTDAGYRTWVKLDDVEWSIVNATLGLAEVIPPELSIRKESTVISDSINSTHPKRIPGATIEYTITVTNKGFGKTDNNSIVINDEIAPNLNYIPNSLQFSNGSPSSTLTAGAANFSYSVDGVTYNSTQSNATKFIRVSPQGQFAPATTSGDPSFIVRFRGLLQ